MEKINTNYTFIKEIFMNYENAYKLLEEKGQLHLLKYYDTLSEAEQAALLNQISEIDFSLIDMIGHNSSGSDSDIAPVAALQMDSIAEKYDIYKNAGLEADRKSTRLNSSHKVQSRMPSSA